MLRIPLALGLIAITLAPFAAEEITNGTSPPSLRPQHERARTFDAAVSYAPYGEYSFVAARNIEINRAMALHALTIKARFIEARNREIRQSLAAYASARAARFAEERNREIEASMAAYERQRTREFVAQRNMEIRASLAAYEAVRPALQIAARNAEIAQSLAAYERNRTTRLAEARNAERERALDTAFAAQRNAEIERSIALVESRRTAEFAAARNAEIRLALAAYHAARPAHFVIARNLEIAQSMAAYEAEREKAFILARNREIEISIAAAETQRTLAFAKARNIEIDIAMTVARLNRPRVITGSIDATRPTALKLRTAATQATPGAEACLSMVKNAGPLYWERTTSRLSAQDLRALDDLAAAARRCIDIVIVINGHTDALGSAPANKRLSEQRARAIAEELMRRGIEKNRLIAVGHGAASPAAPNGTAEERAQNRRIEFTIRNGAQTPKLSELLRTLY